MLGIGRYKSANVCSFFSVFFFFEIILSDDVEAISLSFSMLLSSITAEGSSGNS